MRCLADDRDVEIPMFDHDLGGGGPFTTVVFVFDACPISACVSFWSKTRVCLGQAFGTMGDSTLVARADDAVARSKSIAPTSSDESPGDGELRLVDAASGQVERVVEHSHWAFAVAWHPSGSRLATGCSDDKLRLVDAASGQAKRASRSPSQKMTSATIGTPM